MSGIDTKTSGKSVSRTVTRNSIFSILANGWYLVSRFLLTPFILYHLSLEEYGLWIIGFVIVSFLGMTSIGLESAYIKYTAEFHATGERHKANGVLSAGMTVSIVVSVALVAAVLFGMPWIHNLLGVGPHLKDAATVIFSGVCLVFLLDISLGAYGCALDGLQHIELTRKIRIGTTFLEIALIIIFLSGGAGIYGMMGAFILRYLVALILKVYYAYRLVPELMVRPWSADRDSYRLLLSFGGQMQLLGVIGLFLRIFDRIIIARFAGLGAAGLYEIGRKIPYTAAFLPMEACSSIMPAASHLKGRNDSSAIKALYMSASRYINIISAPLFSFIAIAAPHIICLWVGKGFSDSGIIMTILSVGMYVNLLTGSCSATVRGVGMPKRELEYGILNLVLCVVLTPLFTIHFGSAGAAAGISIGTAVASIFFIVRTNRLFKIWASEYASHVLLPGLVCIVSAVALRPVLDRVLSPDTPRLYIAAALAGGAVLHVVLSSLVLAISGGFTASEKQWVSERITGLFATAGKQCRKGEI